MSGTTGPRLAPGRGQGRIGAALLWGFLCFAAAYALLLLVDGIGLTGVAG